MPLTPHEGTLLPSSPAGLPWRLPWVRGSSPSSMPAVLRVVPSPSVAAVIGPDVTGARAGVDRCHVDHAWRGDERRPDGSDDASAQ